MKRAPPNRRTATPRIAAATLRPAQLLALQAFDVAVRLGSFKEAADVLNLSPSAVSHRIRNLEEETGVALFVRNHRAIEPTTEGRRLAGATGRAFAELARVDLPAGRTPGRQRLKLKVFPLFASAWLIPRLASFVAKHPDIDLAIETSMHNVDFNVEAFDAGISVSNGSFAGLDALHLAPLRATPVATPALARRLKLREPRDLGRAVLIHVTPFPGAWPQWLKRAGVAKLKPARSIAVDNYVAAIQAAEQGAGIALGMEPFIAARERQGAICRLFPIVSSAGSYWLVHPPPARRNRALEVFKHWLLAELGDLHDAR
ncbi:LysR substrate-binding domain-containing protein [Bradyrhizobium sp. LHD-71]|uniref:LysR substrate-binding domain-containing protein n=1 Tax=Bradyrhizobium sp. LHD-71 TaxID=3072141 RepID=UPI00280EA4C4|nr:LysR substrate-binding domain-containing protein [Bradyrhizobium sp. LHD-71]MDQ8726493.1 LysR substrate-binding domain-containing protein [Bradyrhizobium sp. LHD-71]